MNVRKRGIGKRLTELHRWNGWIVVVLAATGLLLAWEPVRGWLQGYFRNPVKQLHIVLGIMSAILLAFYLPLLPKHLKQIRRSPKQKANLVFVLALLAGWLISGIVLWQIRSFPPAWANGALLVHDLFTWIGGPYLVYHSIARLKWMRRPERRAIRVEEETEEAGSSGGRSPYGEPVPLIHRRQFLKWTAGAAIAAVALPSFVRWLASSGGGGMGLPGVEGMAGSPGADANRMLPPPTPLPDSANVIGGGAQGHFRMYTVTRLPTFDSDTWSFRIFGLVDRPAEWNWEQFLALVRTVQVSDFHCVTGWSVYGNTWEGVPLAAVLEAAGVKPSAKYVKFYSGDGTYTDALTLEQAGMDDILLALMHDGKPIHRDYGGPVRLIVPKMYAYKSVKWLSAIELIDSEHIGYWEERGYDTNAWVKG